MNRIWSGVLFMGACRDEAGDRVVAAEAQEWSLEGREKPYGVVIADLTGDGTPDIGLPGIIVEDGRYSWWSTAIYDGPGGHDRAAAAPDEEWVTANVWPGPPLGVGDFDGDGFVDLWLPVYTDQPCALLGYGPFLGTRKTDGLDALPDGFVEVCTPDQGLQALTGPVAIGDFDGDGVSDLAFGTHRTSSDQHGSSSSIMALLLGPIGATSTSTLAGVVSDASNGGELGYDVVGADLNGDGMDDMAIAQRTVGNLQNGVWIYYGAVQGERTTDDADVAIVTPDPTGVSALAVGDLDGDGSADLVAAERPAGAHGPRVAGLYGPFGASGPTDASTLWSTRPEAGELSGLEVGDADGDGLLDVAVAAPHDGTTGADAGAVYLLAGPFPSDPDWEWHGGVPPGDPNFAFGDLFGLHMASGDLDQDGRMDLAITSSSNADTANSVPLLVVPGASLR